jgi:hypothetical protein
MTAAAGPIGRSLKKKYMQGILGHFKNYNFNNLRTSSLEPTHLIHAGLLFSAVNPNMGNNYNNDMYEYRKLY